MPTSACDGVEAVLLGVGLDAHACWAYGSLEIRVAPRQSG